MNIYEKLAAVQQELKAPKDKYNSFGEYHYRSAEGILEAVKPLLAANKATIVIKDDIEQMGDRSFVKATAYFIDCEADLIDAGWRREVEVTAFAELTKEKKKLDASQLTGVASSYARKYALNGLLLIDDTKDADTDEFAKQNGEEKAEKPKKGQVLTQFASEAHIKTIKIMAEKAGIDLNKVMTKPLEELTANEATQMILALKKRIGED